MRQLSEHRSAAGVASFGTASNGRSACTLQRGVVERSYSGPARVAGSAGTGKTVVALHRVMRILRFNTDARVLLTTFSDPLAAVLHRDLKVLSGRRGDLESRVTVASFRRIAEELYGLTTGRKAHLTDREIVRGLIGKTASEAGALGFSSRFLISEWENMAHRRCRRVC